MSAIVRVKQDGTETTVFAEGVRNSVGFDWHPATKKLGFTDNRPDMLGDDVPNDKLNVAWKAGLPFALLESLTAPQYGRAGSPIA